MVLGALACQDLQTGLSPAERITVARYIDCIDCLIPLDSLRALALRKPDATVDSLNSALLYGPGQRAMAEAESVLVIGYVRDSTWRLEHGLLPLEQRRIYINQELQGYAEGYQARGAMGMGWIRTPRAVAHLDSALTLPLPTPVLRAVAYARDSLPPVPP